MRVTEPDVIQRNWGSEQIVIWTPTHAGKILRRKAGTKGGFQCHVKEESHYLYVGELLVEVIEDRTVTKRVVKDGQAWTVPPFTFHRETALTDCILFEVSDPTLDDRIGLIPDPGGLPSLTQEQTQCKLIELARMFELRAELCRDTVATIRKRGLQLPKVAVDA